MEEAAGLTNSLCRQASRAGRFLRRAAAGAIGLGLLSACDNAQPPPALKLTIDFTCDVHGRLEPCGCFTGQYGGLTRLKTWLDEHAAAGALRVDVGDAAAGPEDYNLIQYRYMLRAFGRLNYDALNLGRREVQWSAAQLRALAQNSPVPLISANVLDRSTRQSVVAPFQMLRRGPYRIAVIGVVDPEAVDGTASEDLELAGLSTTLAKWLPALRRQADLIVLLAFADESTLARLAREFYELDIILGGDVRQPAQQWHREIRSLISFVTNEGRAAGRLEVELRPGTRPQPLTHTITLLHDRIAEDEELRQLATAYREEIRHTRLAVDDPARLQADAVPGVKRAAIYVGSDACLDCHTESAEVWHRTGHARAFQALVRRGADADPQCLGCHTVGFGRPSGYRREFGATRLVHVGCESCHGPGSLHVRQQQGEPGVDFSFRPLGAGDCQTCHHGEFSRPFSWDRFWPPVEHKETSESHSTTASR